ncbi:hypothetical protein D3C84_1003070 [compost metagenome]
MAARRITSCQPQKQNAAIFGANNCVWQVRCTEYNELANRAQPPKAKITALVCSGRKRPKLVHGKLKLSSGQTN